MKRKTKYRTFYLTGGTASNNFEAGLADYCKGEYYFSEDAGFVETNAPMMEIRKIARFVGFRLPEFTTSDTPCRE